MSFRNIRRVGKGDLRGPVIGLGETGFLFLITVTRIMTFKPEAAALSTVDEELGRAIGGKGGETRREHFNRVRE